MQVVEDEHERLGVGDVAEEGRGRVEEPEAGALRVERHGRAHVREELAELGEHLRDVGGAASEPLAHGRRILAAHVRPDRLRPRPVGRRTAGLPGAAEEGRRASLPRPLRELVREPALADARLAAEQDEAAAPGERRLERLLEDAELALAADERAVGRLGRRREVERRVLAEDRALQLLQLAARLDPELLDEHAARVLVRGERLCLPPGAVEREHELAAQPLAKRRRRDERLELADEVGVPPGGEVGLDPVLERRGPELDEARRLEPRELAVDVGQGRPVPQRERLPQARGRLLRLPAERPPPLVAEALEPREVELPVLDPERVPRATGGEDLPVRAARSLRLEEPAQRRHVPLQRLDRGRRRPLAPELVDQPVARDGLVRPQEEHREERTLLPGPERYEAAAVANLDRPEDPEVHALILAPLPGPYRPLGG